VIAAAGGDGCPVCGSDGFDLECPGCVVVVQATAVAHGLPQLVAGPMPAGDGGPPAGPVTAAGSVLGVYGRQVDELVAQVEAWQECCRRYAADLGESLRELRGVLAELAGAEADEEGGW
jgi:hypothetical protein